MKKIIYIFVISLLSNCAQQQSYHDFTTLSNYEVNHLSCDDIALEIENIFIFQETGQEKFLNKVSVDKKEYRRKRSYRMKIKKIVQKRLNALNRLAYRKHCL